MLSQHIIKSLSLLTALTIALIGQTGASSPSSTFVQQSSDGANALIEFIEQNGGTVNPKQEIRNVDPSDPTSLRGVFATDDIKNGERLLFVPWDIVMTSPDDDMCKLVFSIRRELELGSESKYGPYVEILNERRDQTGIPGVYSPQGYQLYEQVIGDHLNNSIDAKRHLKWYHSKCKGGQDVGDFDALALEAALLAITRSAGGLGPSEQETAMMIPFYDMYNHRLGSWKNASMKTNNVDGGVEVVATRDIAKGEEIHDEYRNEDDADVSTLFRDYGFVPQTPQFFTFDIPLVILDLRIKVDYADGKSGGRRVLDFPDLAPSDKMNAFAFFESELERLDKLENSFHDGDVLDKLPAFEKNSIVELHLALHTAVEMAFVKLEREVDELMEGDENDEL